MRTVNQRTEMVHDTKSLKSCVFLACNPGMSVGTEVGTKVFWLGSYAGSEQDLTCVKCIKIANAAEKANAEG